MSKDLIHFVVEINKQLSSIRKDANNEGELNGLLLLTGIESFTWIL